MPRTGSTALMPRPSSPRTHIQAKSPHRYEFEDDDFDLSAEDIQPEPPAYYGDALAGAAIGGRRLAF